MNGKICPVLLGADLNCYNIARAFHMEYGVKSYAFGRYAVSATKYSRIVNFTAVADMDSDATMLKILTDFAREHEGERLYLFGCTDDYAAMIIRNRDKLGAYTCPYPPLSLFDSISKGGVLRAVRPLRHPVSEDRHFHLSRGKIGAFSGRARFSLSRDSKAVVERRLLEASV